MKEKLKVMVVTVLACLLAVNMTCGSAFAVSKDTKNLPGSYGKLKGEVYAFKSGGCKNFSSYAETSKKVTKIRAKLAVQYYKSGKNIGPGDTSGWNKNAKYASTYDYDLHHWRNTEQKNDGGFTKTVCVGYGTADAIIEKAYAVYTKKQY